MDVRIYPSTIHGVITAPPSKSVTHRAIILAALAKGTSVIKNALLSDDTKHTIQACKAMGVSIKQQGHTLTIVGSEGNLQAPKKPLHLGHSGSTMRMMTAVACLAKGRTVLTGSDRLKERPMNDLLYALRTQGIAVASLDHNGNPPIAIDGGRLIGGKVKVTANVSSQFVSAMLLVAPFAKLPMEIIVRGLLRSTPYVAITLDLMKSFGVAVKNDNFETFFVPKAGPYKTRHLAVEGDYSSASYFFAAAAISRGTIMVKGLNQKSAQGDRYFLDILKKMSCVVRKINRQITIVGPKKLKAVTVNMGDYPDIVQTLAAVASYAHGATHINHIGHLTHKETDRIADTARELRRMGVDVEATKNTLTIHGGQPKGTRIDSHNDHRMAMSMAVVALGAKGKTIIKHAEVVTKSYPHFFEDLTKVGGKVTIL